MIFACDLDRTLIYSRNSMGTIDPAALVPVEIYDGKEHSFVTRDVYASLRMLGERMLFVPATTRTHEQYRRVHGISEGLSPRYAIVSNGGKVLKDGMPDADWEREVRTALRDGCAPGDEVSERFIGLANEGLALRASYCDELFYAYVLDMERLEEGFMTELETMLQGLGWSSSLQGRKLYLVPDPVSKGAAVRYVKELAGSSIVFAAGDSLLDECMLAVADQAMAPCHGELYRKYGSHGHIRFTESSGIRASEEIINALLKRMEVSAAI
ncbi:hydrolase [Cohnella endophytica]|uniref:Hydrolase n=1 Tax=Cohnella endophytica TaxID=2419778 RepID=A0A494XMR7_9BACL|nr:HAD family hydrolase [Cohnella endophytica]RKP48833.1 hydrolase [Cohnella endophytica]